jgi:hypothetical protein
MDTAEKLKAKAEEAAIRSERHLDSIDQRMQELLKSSESMRAQSEQTEQARIIPEIELEATNIDAGKVVEGAVDVTPASLDLAKEVEGAVDVTPAAVNLKESVDDAIDIDPVAIDLDRVIKDVQASSPSAEIKEAVESMRAAEEARAQMDAAETLRAKAEEAAIRSEEHLKVIADKIEKTLEVG